MIGKGVSVGLLGSVIGHTVGFQQGKMGWLCLGRDHREKGEALN